MSNSQIDPAPRVVPSLGALFMGFLGVSVQGFGGVLPFARRMIVEQRRWLTGPEFTDLLALGQFLPGPNVVNVSVCIGQRFHGWQGAVVAVLGFLGAPVAIIMVLGLVYARWGTHPELRRVLLGVGAAAAGLVIATALKMAWPMRARIWAVALLAASAVSIGILRWPLFHVLAVLVPLGVLGAWYELRRERAAAAAAAGRAP